MVVDHHQLDVLGLRLDGALASPHLEVAKEVQYTQPEFEHTIIVTFMEDKQIHEHNMHTHPAGESIAHTHTDVGETLVQSLSLRRQHNMEIK